MKWPVEIPYMRSAKQAMYVRELTWEYVKNNPGLSYEKMQECINRIDRLSKFISKRSLSLSDWKVSTIIELQDKFGLSQRQINFLYKHQIREKSKGTN